MGKRSTDRRKARKVRELKRLATNGGVQTNESPDVTSIEASRESTEKMHKRSVGGIS